MPLTQNKAWDVSLNVERYDTLAAIPQSSPN